MTRADHYCPTCACDDERIVVDPTAPFFELVVDCDRFHWDKVYADRTARMSAAKVVPSPAPPAGTDAGDGT